jgi:hypothetical protein
MGKFEVSIFKAINLEFEKVSFSSSSGQSPNIAIKFSGVTFAGDLAFVSSSEEFLKDLMALLVPGSNSKAMQFGPPPGTCCPTSVLAHFPCNTWVW